MPLTYVDVFSNQKLEALPGFPAVTEALRFMPNLTVTKGTRLGQISSASANEVQTINYTGTWAAGDTMTLSIVGIDGGTYSTTLTMDATPAFTAANVKAAIDALLAAAGYAGATVTVVNAGPTDQTVTFGGTAAYWDMPLMTAAYVTAGNGTVTVDATTAGNLLGIWGPAVVTKLASPTAGPTATQQASGSLPLLGLYVVTYTVITAVGESLPSPGTPVVLTSANASIDVTPGTLPTGTTGINIYLNGVFAKTSAQTAATLVNVTEFVATAEKPHPDVNTAYTQLDGRHVAKAIAMYDVRTDYMGRIVFAGASQSPQDGHYEKTAPAYFKGAFNTADLASLTAQEVADLGGRLIKGTVTSGVLVI